MPESFTGLVRGDSTDVFLKQRKYFVSLRMIGRQFVEHFGKRENGPSVGSSPEERWVMLHGFYPAVAEKSFFFHPHPV